MKKVSTLQYLTIGAGCMSLIVLGSVHIQGMVGMLIAFAGVLAAFALLTVMADVPRHCFAMDNKNGSLFCPGQSFMSFRRDAGVVSPMAKNFEFQPESSHERIFVGSYCVPSIGNFALASTLAQRSQSLYAYIQDRLSILSGELSQWDLNLMESRMGAFRNEMSDAGVELELQLEQRVVVAQG